MPRPSGDDASSEPSALGGRTADHVPLPATPESVRSTQVSPDLGGMATGRWDSRSPSQVIPKEACADGLSVLGDKDIEVRRRRLCGCWGQPPNPQLKVGNCFPRPCVWSCEQRWTVGDDNVSSTIDSQVSPHFPPKSTEFSPGCVFVR